MSDRNSITGGSKSWFIPDGYLPYRQKTANSGYEGHESLMILNCNDEEAEICIDIFYEDREPESGIALKVPPRRIKCFRLDDPASIGGIKIDRLSQYAIRITSSTEVIVQYGKMDITQDNLAYVSLIAYPGK